MEIQRDSPGPIRAGDLFDEVLAQLRLVEGDRREQTGEEQSALDCAAASSASSANGDEIITSNAQNILD